jgi:peptide/nickel transport system ATP-binding protein
MSGELLSVEDLSVEFHTYDGVIQVLEDVTFGVRQGRWTGLVGETGCGKSVTASAIIRLLPQSARVSGRVLFKGKDLLQKTERAMRRIRGAEISMIFQDPSIAINPALKIGFQIAETIATHQSTNARESRQRAQAILQKVGLGSYVMDQYAYELSGGMLQRVMIGLALSCDPDLILADEPTSSLDVTIQKDILSLMKELSSISQTAMLFITHDLVLVGQTCDEVVVMYAGMVVERGSTEAVLDRSFHPYTRALVNAIPTIDTRKDYLEEIEGNVPDLLLRPPGCPFASRCKFKMAGLCESVVPRETRLEEGHYTRCHLAG